MQPLMFQRVIVRASGVTSGNEYNPKVFSQIMLVLAHNFPQMTSNSIANNCASEAP